MNLAFWFPAVFLLGMASMVLRFLFWTGVKKYKTTRDGDGLEQYRLPSEPIQQTVKLFMQRRGTLHIVRVNPEASHEAPWSHVAFAD